jgi:hypothetical protein
MCRQAVEGNGFTGCCFILDSVGALVVVASWNNVFDESENFRRGECAGRLSKVIGLQAVVTCFILDSVSSRFSFFTL